MKAEARRDGDGLEELQLIAKVFKRVRETKEAEAFRNALPARVRSDSELTELLVSYLGFMRAQMDAFWSGRIPRPISKRSQAKVSVAARRLAGEIRDLHEFARIYLLRDGVDVGRLRRDLDRIATVFSSGAADAGRSMWKSDAEDRVAYLLRCSAIRLTTYRDGVLAVTLRAMYEYLGIAAGAEPKRVLARLCADKLDHSKHGVDVAVSTAMLRELPASEVMNIYRLMRSMPGTTR